MRQSPVSNTINGGRGYTSFMIMCLLQHETIWEFLAENCKIIYIDKMIRMIKYCHPKLLKNDHHETT